METYNTAALTLRLFQSGRAYWSTKGLKTLFGIEIDSSLKKVIARLVVSGVLVVLEKGKYRLMGVHLDEFEMANMLYGPSYVSLESALNLWGVLSQFPYAITSVTTKKTMLKEVDQRRFEYVHIKQSHFFGYEKRVGHLMATREKAILDWLYLASKGLRSGVIDEWDMEAVNVARLISYLPSFSLSDQMYMKKKLKGVLP